MKVILIKAAIKTNNIKNAVSLRNESYIFAFYFIKNYQLHNSKFPAEYITNNKQNYIKKYYHLYDNDYGSKLNIKQWFKKVKQLKREKK